MPAAGDYTITAALTDKAGNSNSTTHEVEVNLTAPVLTIDTVSGDDVINSSEKTQDLTITGTASGLAAGAVVTVMLNGKAYSATVDTNGQWTTTVPASEVGQLGEALYTVSASATDSVGNSSSTSHTVNVESVLPGVIINTVAGDDVINAAELATGQTISGTVVNAEAGNTVTVSVGGHSYTATVQDNLTVRQRTGVCAHRAGQWRSDCDRQRHERRGQQRQRRARYHYRRESAGPARGHRSGR